MRALNYDAITAAATVALALAAAIALFVESSRARFSLGIELLLKFDERFHSPEMKALRKAAAQALLAGRPVEAEDVLDFFETIGALVKKGTLDERMVWHTFFVWINGYVTAADEHIAATRSANATIWQDLISLRAKAIAIEKAERTVAISQVRLSKEAVRRFLEDEASL